MANSDVKPKRIQHRCAQWLNKEDAIRQMAAKSLGKVTKVKNRRSLPIVATGIQLELTSSPSQIMATKQTSIQNFFAKPKQTDKSKGMDEAGMKRRKTPLKITDQRSDRSDQRSREVATKEIIGNHGNRSAPVPATSYQEKCVDSESFESPVMYQSLIELGSIHTDNVARKRSVNQCTKESKTSIALEGCGIQYGTETKKCVKGVGKHSHLLKRSVRDSKMEIKDSELRQHDELALSPPHCNDSQVVKVDSQLSDHYDLSQKSSLKFYQKEGNKSYQSCDQSSPALSCSGEHSRLLETSSPLSEFSLSQESLCSDIFMGKNSQSISQKMRQFDQEMKLIYNNKPKQDIDDLISSESETCESPVYL